MQVGNSRKLFSDETSIESIQAFDTFIFPFDVSLHKSYVGCKICEEWSGKGATEYGDSYVRILFGQRIDYWYSHGNISHG